MRPSLLGLAYSTSPQRRSQHVHHGAGSTGVLQFWKRRLTSKSPNEYYPSQDSNRKALQSNLDVPHAPISSLQVMWPFTSPAAARKSVTLDANESLVANDTGVCRATPFYVPAMHVRPCNRPGTPTLPMMPRLLHRGESKAPPYLLKSMSNHDKSCG